MNSDWIIENIKNLIHQKGIKVENISKDLGISKGEFSKIMNGQRKDYIKYLPAIADYLKVGYKVLLLPRDNHNNADNKNQADRIYQELYERLILQFKVTQEANSDLIQLLKESCETYKNKYINEKQRVDFLEGRLRELENLTE